MSKSVNNLYSKLLSYEALETAFYQAAQGKSNKFVVSQFRNNLPVELLQLLVELRDRTYRPRPYKTFHVYLPKSRTIHAPHFRDVIVQRAIHNLIEPLFERTFIHDSYGCRVGKGTHRASDTVQRMMRSVRSIAGSESYDAQNSYYLQMDIAKYFYNIDRDILIGLLKRRISDVDLLELLSMFIPQQTGIPIGNLLSQLFQNIYMNVIDHFCKRDLGVRYYVRYVDDFVIIGQSKQDLHHQLVAIEKKLKTLKLTLSRFTIQKLNHGINFCGYRTWVRTKFVRRRAVDVFNGHLKRLCRDKINTEQIQRSLRQCLGHQKPTANYRNFKRKFNLLCQQSTNIPQLQ